jgi:DNA-binding SARP family transcriptional activator
MDFRILGPVEVFHDDRPVPLAGLRQERILAMLLVNQNRMVTTTELVDAMWPADPPATATNQVRNCVAALRRGLVQLGLPPSALLHKAHGYLLVVAPMDLDAARFTALVNAGRAAARQGLTEVAVDRLRAAQRLWRGPALAGLADDVLVLAGEAARLEELRLHALEDWMALELDAGRHHHCVAELTGLTRRYPLRERLQAILMLALYRCGRTAEALDVYERTRRRLRDEFAVEPGTELRDLWQLVLTGRPAHLTTPDYASAGRSYRAADRIHTGTARSHAGAA